MQGTRRACTYSTRSELCPDVALEHSDLLTITVEAADSSEQPEAADVRYECSSIALRRCVALRRARVVGARCGPSEYCSRAVRCRNTKFW